jgi:hypothetical protein
MNQGQLAGRIGPFADAATGQHVGANVQGTFGYQVQGDPAAVLPRLQAALLGATQAVVQQKLAAGQVALPTLSMSMPHFVPEIIAQSGAASLGAHVAQLSLQVAVDAPAMMPGHAGPMPPDPMQATANAFSRAAKDRLDPRNYDYQVTANIGGFKLKASTDGGFDSDGLANQAIDKAKSTLVWWAIFAGIGLVVVLFLVGLGWWIWRKAEASMGPPQTDPKGKADVVTWDGKTPYSCGGDDHVTIKGVTANIASGTAISAGAACRLELVDVNVTAPTGLQAMGNAIIIVNGGSVTGKEFAAKALGNGQVTFKGTKVNGKTQALGKAKINGAK